VVGQAVPPAIIRKQNSASKTRAKLGAKLENSGLENSENSGQYTQTPIIISFPRRLLFEPPVPDFPQPDEANMIRKRQIQSTSNPQNLGD
jgi:hypothetical protein